jgi:hypothetical protein
MTKSRKERHAKKKDDNDRTQREDREVRDEGLRKKAQGNNGNRAPNRAKTEGVGNCPTLNCRYARAFYRRSASNKTAESQA